MQDCLRMPQLQKQSIKYSMNDLLLLCIDVTFNPKTDRDNQIGFKYLGLVLGIRTWRKKNLFCDVFSSYFS